MRKLLPSIFPILIVMFSLLFAAGSSAQVSASFEGEASTETSSGETSANTSRSRAYNDPIWQERTGAGITFGIGGNDCTGDICNYYWDSSFFPSIALSAGFIYRWSPHWMFFAELHNGFISSDRGLNSKNDWMNLFELSGGAEFHYPVSGWLDPFLGAGIGYTYLGAWANEDGQDLHDALHGFLFQARFGADFYLFSAAPKFSIAPIFKVGFPIWAKACFDDGRQEDCRSRSNFSELSLDADGGTVTLDESGAKPFTFYFGFAGRYLF